MLNVWFDGRVTTGVVVSDVEIAGTVTVVLYGPTTTGSVFQLAEE